MKLFLILFVLWGGWAIAQDEAPVIEKQFSKVWLKTELFPVNFTWQDLALSKEASFTGPITEAWKKWLSENLAPTVGEVDVCLGDCLTFIGEWESRPQKEVLALPSPQYSGQLLLKVSINLWRPLVSVQGQIFHWEGRLVLIDINTKRVMSIRPIGPYERQFEGYTQSELNSALGNQIYRSVLALLKDQMNRLEKAVRLNSTREVTVKGHRNVLDALELMKLVQTRGSHLALQATMTSFSKQEAILWFFYQGEAKSFTDLLNRLNELKSSHSYKLVPEVTESSTVIQMLAE